MSRIVIKGGMLISPTEERFADLCLENEKIAGVGGATTAIDSPEAQEIDASGCYVTPGLFDLQVNGCPECDFWAELDEAKLASISRVMLSAGVTSILPTLITADLARLRKNRDFLKPHLGLSGSPASARTPVLVRMPGLHFEGPCLSPEKPGVHPKEHLQPLEPKVLKEFVDDSCKLITVASELDARGECLKYLKEKNVVCSLGHSNATFDEARQAFDRGVTMMTHTFNALPPLHHRDPGAVGAALLDRRINCCVIPDGMHVLPPMVELVFRLKGPDKTIIVTDVAAIGTSKGGLVGSSLSLDQGVRNMVNWGICTFAQAIRMATLNPARAMNLEDSIGQIKPGAYADILLWDRETLEIKKVIFNGSVVDLKEKVGRSSVASA